MLVFNLKDAIPFSDREKAFFVKMCELWLKYNPKIASFLYMIMGKDPSETDYKLDLSNISVKWTSIGDTYVLGQWSPVTPNTIYIGAHNIFNADNFKGERQTISTRIDRYELMCNEIMTAFPIVMHEFYHMFQCKSCPVGYIVMRLVTLFTKMPYYLAQYPALEKVFPNGVDTKWIVAWNNFTKWDLEGQAEMYGDKAEHIEEFLKAMNSIYSSYCYQRNLYRSHQRDVEKYGKDSDEAKNSKVYADEYVKNACDEYSDILLQQGKELFDVYHSNTTRK